MANTIKIKRGLSSGLSSLTLQEGEPAITTDTKKLYIGNSDGSKIEIGQQGPRGTKWWVGDFYSEMFTDALDGDLLLNTSEMSPGEVLQFYDGMWSPVTNIRGPQGEKGPSGEGVPAGGTTGQVLAKASDTDNDTEWVDQTGGDVTFDYSTSNLISDANLVRKTGGYYTNNTTLNLPEINYDTLGYLDVKSEAEDETTVQYWINRSSLETYVRAWNWQNPVGWKDWRLANSGIVKEETLTSNMSILNITGLENNGGAQEYEVTLESYTDASAELLIYINGIDDLAEYYHTVVRTYGTSPTNIAHNCGYNPQVTTIGGWLYTTTSEYPNITKMKIFYTPCKDGNGGKISYIVDHSCSYVDKFSQVRISGVMQSDYDGITAVMFKPSSGTFLTGTRATVRKVR